MYFSGQDKALQGQQCQNSPGRAKAEEQEEPEAALPAAPPRLPGSCCTAAPCHGTRGRALRGGGRCRFLPGVPGEQPSPDQGRSVVAGAGSTARSGAGSAEWGGGDGAGEMGQGILSKCPIPEQLPCLPRKPSRFISPYGRCTEECAFKSLHGLDSADQNSPRGHVNYKFPHWEILEETGGCGRRLGEGSGPSCCHAKVHKWAFQHSSGCSGPVKLPGTGGADLPFLVVFLPSRWSSTGSTVSPMSSISSVCPSETARSMVSR